VKTYLHKEARRHGSSLQVDLRMKAQAVKICKVNDKPVKKQWKKNKDLLDFLNNI
jgi:hypothetical protein